MSFSWRRFREYRCPWTDLLVVFTFFSCSLLTFFSLSAAADSRTCSADYAKLDFLTEEARSRVLAFSKNAANFVRSNFDSVSERQNVELTKHGLPEIKTGIVEPIVPASLPKDERLAAMANKVNFLFQDQDSIVSFVQVFAEDIAARLAKEGRLKSSDLFLTSKAGFPHVLQDLASDQGWGPILWDPGYLPRDKFRTEVLASGKLWYEHELADTTHTGSSHIIQWLYVTPALEKEFGPGAAKDLLKYMSTPEGYSLWETLFDRAPPPSFFRDFRGPSAFSAYRLAGPLSWFGVP